MEFDFSDRLITWYQRHARSLPWRETTDPYRIWLSEIILQQTRVEQGLPYYLRFIENFPDIHHLASAPEEKVMRCWQGLGYYSRARNLHHTAKYLSSEKKGSFPTSYQELLKLKGVGPYTAAAIASFAFQEAVPVVDGNVYRFVSRYFGIHEPIGTAKAYKLFFELLSEFIPENDPASFNQALMEFGSLQCLPKNPNCWDCPFQTGCEAFRRNEQSLLPIKNIKTKVKRVSYHLAAIKGKKGYWLTQRDDSGLWKKLWHFPLWETEENLSESEGLGKLLEVLALDPEKVRVTGKWTTTHLLSHRRIEAIFWMMETDQHPAKNFIFEIDENALDQHAMPQLMVKFFNSQAHVGK
ncbi:MAG: A/G-specific adenine glycosylase [Bacteroidota bacterium]|nr:A/G-specific adenine glycosylase [Bacteroidota bacterium]MDX5429906.1 A/G-specific adenine glycosylase [Bacteroidota bacterium]MDX5468680.1 A/G-specific adenine glycosylase [Bacteroidota bacterium]